MQKSEIHIIRQKTQPGTVWVLIAQFTMHVHILLIISYISCRLDSCKTQQHHTAVEHSLDPGDGSLSRLPRDTVWQGCTSSSWKRGWKRGFPTQKAWFFDQRSKLNLIVRINCWVMFNDQSLVGDMLNSWLMTPSNWKDQLVPQQSSVPCWGSAGWCHQESADVGTRTTRELVPGRNSQRIGHTGASAADRWPNISTMKKPATRHGSITHHR